MSQALRNRPGVALLAVLLAACAALAFAAPRASATSGEVPIDEPPSGGGPCDNIPLNGVPSCDGSGIPPEGSGIPCIDPSLPCGPYEPGGPPAPIRDGLEPFDTTCVGFILAHQAGRPAVIREQVTCPANSVGVTRAAFRAGYQKLANLPECNVGDVIVLHYTQRDSNANGRYEDDEADDPTLGECFAADAQRNPIGAAKATLTLP
jgi:hypothetical protein